MRMLTQDQLLANRDDPRDLAAAATDDDISLLVAWLKEKDDNLRYAAFLLLQALSAQDDRVFAHWPTFVGMIENGNSYQRSLGLMLIAENVRWDAAGRFGDVCPKYLDHCDDEKFIIAHQALQGLLKIIAHTDAHREAIIGALMAIGLDGRKDSQKNLMLLDIIEVLAKLHVAFPDERIEAYLRAKLEIGNDRVKKRIKGVLGRGR